ncbi:MAG: class I SAM-dependent methyltransferase [Candidatus Promineifilaceae bacterium]
MWKRKIGVHLLRFMPKRVERLKSEGYSMTIGRRNILDSLVRAGIAEQHFSENRLTELAEYHQRFWEKDGGTHYHEHIRDSVLDIFQDKYGYMISQLTHLLKEMPTIDTIVEVGCGGGSVLNYLLSEFDDIDRFVGIDLSPETIQQNQELYPNQRLDWVAADGKKWLEENGTPNMLVFSFRGVFEYFTQTDLSDLFSHIATQMQPSVLMLVEPVGLTQNLETQKVSETYGTEYSFSHGYPILVGEAGFDIRHVGIQTFEGHRLVAVVGAANPDKLSPSVGSVNFARP